MYQPEVAVLGQPTGCPAAQVVAPSDSHTLLEAGRIRPASAFSNVRPTSTCVDKNQRPQKTDCRRDGFRLFI